MGRSQPNTLSWPGLIMEWMSSTSAVETPPHPDCCAIRPLPANGERLESSRLTGTETPLPLVGEASSLLRLSPLAGRGRSASALRVRGSFRKRGRNGLEHATDIAEHVVVPKSQDTILVTDKPIIADHVTRIVCVLTTIDLNDETAFPANEVHSVKTNGILTDELVPIQPSTAKTIPESRLCICRSASQLPSSIGFCLITRTHVDSPLTRRAARAGLSPQAGRGDSSSTGLL
jgi:hypothetical protein